VDDIPVQACPTHAPSFTTTIQKKQIFVETDKYASYNPEGETKRLCASVQVPEHDRGQTRLNTKPVCHHLECKKLRYVFSFRRHHSLCTDHFFSQGMFKTKPKPVQTKTCEPTATLAVHMDILVDTLRIHTSPEEPNQTINENVTNAQVSQRMAPAHTRQCRVRVPPPTKPWSTFSGQMCVSCNLRLVDKETVNVSIANRLRASTVPLSKQRAVETYLRENTDYFDEKYAEWTVN
jgi:hypothetical protein